MALVLEVQEVQRALQQCLLLHRKRLKIFCFFCCVDLPLVINLISLGIFPKEGVRVDRRTV